MKNVLITGSNRGLGLEWVRQYANNGWRVYASCRLPEKAESLFQLANQYQNVSIHQLDVTSTEDIQQITSELNGIPLDVLVNNAGIYRERWGKDKLGQINYADWQETFDVNTLGAMRVSEALFNNLILGHKKLIVAISSHMGSIADITTANDYAYRSSKTALNAAMKGLSLEVSKHGVGVLLLHPGWVRTRMGGESAPLSIEESVTKMRAMVDSFQLNQSGGFYRYDGLEISW